MQLALVGATGLVGSTVLELLGPGQAEKELGLAASPASVGKHVQVQGRSHRVCSVEDILAKRPKVVIMTASAAVARVWAPRFAAIGSYVIDNSSAFRQEPHIPLVVPEVNGHLLRNLAPGAIVANPNCIAVPLTMVMAPLHRHADLQSVVVSTYQSVSSSGYKGIHQLQQEQAGALPYTAYAKPIHHNVLPHIGHLGQDGHSGEEVKILQETQKILESTAIAVHATAVRVPVLQGHAMSVYARFQRPISVQEARDILADAAGVLLYDDPAQEHYPTPLQVLHGDTAWVGRIRQPLQENNTLQLWIAADNLRKGAASNALHIAREIAGITTKLG